ncbi:hypothetical protein PsorP6_002474 [Peronosclerospora sorghi]|uniref:Uncharacterized protein n=1 Tax=Peronosclerospora sorghi TaxID=230839 RepID=A0ACC0WUW9_9STRA|nr:hypothetical protein PsorP6_002474 [Peronosclerospora sorghi]
MRSSAVKSLKELAVSVNEHGKSVCISPEGMRSKDGLVSNRSDYISCFISTLLPIAWPDDDSLVSAEYFVLGKSLALCNALYDLAHVTAIFTWETMHARLTHAGTTAEKISRMGFERVFFSMAQTPTTYLDIIDDGEVGGDIDNDKELILDIGSDCVRSMNAEYK